jgi:DNA repair exonuclease SbcCD ATPase subunit
MSQIEELQSRILAAMDRIASGTEILSSRPAIEPADTGGAASDLAQLLDEEKLANAQLQERLKALKARHAEELVKARAEGAAGGSAGGSAGDADLAAELERQLAAANERVAELEGTIEQQAGMLTAQAQDVKVLKAEVSHQAQAMEQLDAELQRLRRANDELRKSNATLREANSEGIGDPDLVNKAMLAELEGLRATQAADSAEVSAVLSRLDTLLSNARNLPEGEEV